VHLALGFSVLITVLHLLFAFGYRHKVFIRLLVDIRATRRDHNDHVFVSEFFPVLYGEQRHDIDTFRYRLSRLLMVFKGRLFLFTNATGKRMLFAGGPPCPNNVIIVSTFRDLLEIPRFRRDFPAYEELHKKYMSRFFKGRFLGQRSAMLGVIWNAKVFFMQHVLRLVEDCGFLHWLDIGIVKTDDYVRRSLVFPSDARLAEVFGAFNNERMLFCLRPPTSRLGSLTLQADLVLGSFDISETLFVHGCYFGGPVAVVRHFLDQYLNFHDFLLARGQYVLNDELIEGLYCRYFPDRCMFVNAVKSRCFWAHAVVGFLGSPNSCGGDTAVLVLRRKGPLLIPMDVPLKRDKQTPRVT